MYSTIQILQQWENYRHVNHFSYNAVNRTIAHNSIAIRGTTARDTLIHPTNAGRAIISWLMHYATSRKIEGSIPSRVTGFLSNLPNPFSRTVALGLTHPLRGMTHRESSWLGKARPVRKADNFTACSRIQ
jgi:hypothetical protein